jgi:hypothetical protein
MSKRLADSVISSSSSSIASSSSSYGWITVKRIKGNDGAKLERLLFDNLPRHVLDTIVKLYATLKWREYMSSARRTRGCGAQCEEFSGLVASVRIPEGYKKEDKYSEIPYGWFPFSKFYWGPTNKEDPEFGTFYTFPDVDNYVPETPENEDSFKKAMRERRGLPFVAKLPPPSVDRLKIGEPRPPHRRDGGVFTLRDYQCECDARIKTHECEDALVLPVSKCHLGFDTCTNPCHKGNSLISFKSLAFREKDDIFSGFRCFLNVVVNGSSKEGS